MIRRIVANLQLQRRISLSIPQVLYIQVVLVTVISNILIMHTSRVILAIIFTLEAFNILVDMRNSIVTIHNKVISILIPIITMDLITLAINRVTHQDIITNTKFNQIITSSINISKCININRNIMPILDIKINRNSFMEGYQSRRSL